MEAEVISASDKSYSIGFSIWLSGWHIVRLSCLRLNEFATRASRYLGWTSAPVSPNGTCGKDPRFQDLLRRMNLQP